MKLLVFLLNLKIQDASFWDKYNHCANYGFGEI